jgi:hypothetical protein
MGSWHALHPFYERFYAEAPTPPASLSRGRPDRRDCVAVERVMTAISRCVRGGPLQLRRRSDGPRMSTSAKTASFWSPERGPRDQQDRRTSAVPLHAEGRTLTPNEPMPLHQTAASPHCGQRQRCREVQNRVVSFFPAWRAGAVFVHDSDLSNFFAESISVVPKPSVNRS